MKIKNMNFIGAVFILSLTSCDVSQEAAVFANKVKALFGGQRPEQAKGSEPLTENVELAKENSELLFEMLTVVFDKKEVDNKEEFSSLLYSMNQGASLEGIYRGLVMGARYRGIEGQSQAASPKTLKLFALELAELQSDMKNPSVFREGESSKPLEIDFPDGAATEYPAAPGETKVKVKPKIKIEEIAVEHLKMFLGASSFTLKRVLGEEALKRIDEFKSAEGQINTIDLAQWYAKLAVRMTNFNINFGLDLRNKNDFDFHYLWAQKRASDRVKWEVLNRYHCLINAVSKQPK